MLVALQEAGMNIGKLYSQARRRQAYHQCE